MTAEPLTMSEWLTPEPKDVRDTTIASILRSAAADAPDRVAFVAGATDPADRVRRTYAEVLTEAQAVARALGARYEAGERIAVLAPSTPELFTLSFAAALARLILVPMNPLLRPAEIEHICERSKAAAIFHVAAHRGNDLTGTVEALHRQLPELRDVIDLATWSELVATGTTLSTELVDPDPDDVAQLVFTSGTTGAAKGVMLTHRGMTNGSRLGGARFDVRPGDVYVNTIPLFHVGGQGVTFQIMQALATNVVLTQFDAGLQLELLETEQATHTVGVPTMFQAVIEHPDYAKRDLGSLRCISSGGAMVPVEMIRFLERSLGVQTAIVFGQTEGCGYISQTFLSDAPDDKSTTIGQILEHLDGKVVDRDTGDVVPVGQIGELLVRGAGVMAGYFDDPSQTAETLDSDGWLRTGDLVTMDARGYLRVTGRAKDMIVTGGLNVYPAEIERVIGSHVAVGEVAVLAVPDERWGETVVAVVRPVPGETVDAEGLEAYTRELLAPYKVPKRWVFAAELPMTVSGKVQKFVLRDQLLNGEL